MVLIPDWPAPPGIHALCSTRAGGVSQGAFASLNLGDHVGDAPAAVQANRLRLQALLQAQGAAPVRPVFLRQVHGVDCLELTPHSADGSAADACASTTAGLACTIMVADCLPVLLAHRSGAVVAAAHAGWRGLAQGVLEATLERFSALALTSPARVAPKNIASNTLAWLGPCIGPQAFEVGAEVYQAFCVPDLGAAVCFTPQPGGKYLADLAALARRRLAALGVTAVYGNDSSAPWCTVGNASRFFSHRAGSRIEGGSGRFAASVWIAG